MSDISDIATLVRYQVLDFVQTLQPGDIFTYGSSTVFTLSQANVVEITAVYVNSTLLTSGYSLNSSTNKLTITSSLTAGDTVEIQYTYYPKYSSVQIENFVRSSVVYLSVNNYYTFEVDESDYFYPQLSDRERNLVAFVTAILMKPDNKSYRLPDISVTVPKSLPTRDLIGKAICIFKHNSSGVFNIN